MHVEYIDPHGSDAPANLCLSCSSYNLSKATAIAAADPETEETVRLFNPRLQSWLDHFEWVESGLRIRGKTPTGRATVARLTMNQPRLVRARRNWIIAGNHPPTAE